MLVIPSKQALVFKAANPAQIQACIPHARQVTHKGHQLLAVHHGIEEVQVLRNLGAPAPSPMNFYHEYPRASGRYDPFAHQRETCDFLTLHRRCAILNSPRTGKTLSCLWTADYFIKLGLIRKILIVAPLSTLDPVWAQAIFETFWWYKFAVLHGTAEKRRKLINQSGAQIFIVNHDGFGIIRDDLPDDIDLCIYDEAAVVRNPQSNRFKLFSKWVDSRPNIRLWLLTGTPTPNEPTDAWALCKLIGAPVPRYTAFREMVMQKIAQWTWRPRHDAEKIVSQYLQPSIRFTRDECFDLPETMYETRQCEMTPEQKRMYHELLKQLASEMEGQTVTAVNEAVKVQKLCQVLLGCIYADTGESVYIDASPRIAVIREIIEECEEKVIIFVPFTGALEAIATALRKEFTVEIINGDVSKSARDDIFRRFSDTPHPRLLVADARAMSHGLDLTAATTIIWAGPTNSNEVYEQACARIMGPKQKHKTSIVHIEATAVEQKIYKRLREKGRMQGILLDIIQNQEMR